MSEDAIKYRGELPPREKGIQDLRESSIKDVVEAVKSEVDDIKSIWVVGSFARGEGRNVVSDLDLRVVTNTQVGHIDALKTDYHPPDGASFGWVDAFAAPAEPNTAQKHKLEGLLDD